MKQCPQCSKHVGDDAWLCDCGHEFNNYGAASNPQLCAVRERKPMKTRTKRIWLSLASVFLIGICGIVWQNRVDAIACTLTWGRLAPFPSSAKRFTISTTGNMFTRGFRSSFTAPAADIEQWLQQSPGTRSVQPTSPTPGIRVFGIEPGGGAQFAEVTVDDINHGVSIRVWWS